MPEVSDPKVSLGTPEPPAIKGDYVLATKFNDGDPGDPWAVGYYLGSYEHCGVETRHLVGDAAGKSFRANGYRRVARIKQDFGNWLLEGCVHLERAPPGVSLWALHEGVEKWNRETADTSKAGAMGEDDE